MQVVSQLQLIAAGRLYVMVRLLAGDTKHYGDDDNDDSHVCVFTIIISQSNSAN